jgi:hypothetical protein
MVARLRGLAAIFQRTRTRGPNETAHSSSAEPMPLAVADRCGGEIIDDPEPKHSMRVQIFSERCDILDGQIRYDAFGEHQDVSRTRIYCRKQRAPGGHVGKIELHPFKPTSRPLVRQAAVFEFDEVRVIPLRFGDTCARRGFQLNFWCSSVTPHRPPVRAPRLDVKAP